jgi:uncharacterized protein
LQESLIGNFVASYQKNPKRRMVLAPKFYFFDVGVANFLLNRKKIKPHTFVFGFAFVHFIFQELQAHKHYFNKNFSITYWRTTSGFEVDFVLGEAQVAIEVKGTKEIQSKHSKGLKAFGEASKVKKKIIVCLEDYPRLLEENILAQP